MVIRPRRVTKPIEASNPRSEQVTEQTTGSQRGGTVPGAEDEVAPTPHDIEAEAARARAQVDAAAITGRAEVDAQAIIAAAEADAAALRAQAELAADEYLRQAEAEREEARLVLESARAEADDLLAQASELRRRTEQETLRRLLATRADLHDAIERLREMAEPVLDLTDSAAALGGAGTITVPGSTLSDLDEEPSEPMGPESMGPEAMGPEGSLEGAVSVGVEAGAEADPVATLVRSAIGRAVDSATRSGSARSGNRPAQWREQLRDGRNVL